jgi:rhombotail lipoprotein
MDRRGGLVMRKTGVVCVLMIFMLLAGCKSLHPDPPHFDPALRARLAPPFYASVPQSGDGTTLFTAQREATNKAVAEILKIEPSVRFSKEKPITLAIAEVGRTGVETVRQEDKDAWRKALEETGLVKVIFISSVILSANPGFHEMRLAAARLHADVMLLYALADSDESRTNLSGLLYLTIVGTFFTPGSESAVLSFAKGACFDVENEFLEFTVEGEDERKVIRPYYFLDRKQLRLDSRKAALGILREETVRAVKSRAEVK